jgi:hypothetical protein
LRRQTSFQFESTVIPDDHFARAIISLGDLALELRVFERMVFGLNSEPFIPGIHRRAFWHGPGFHHAIYFQAKIVMKAARVVFLNDKRRPVPRRPPAGGLWSGVKTPLAFVFCKRHRQIIRAQRPQRKTEIAATCSFPDGYRLVPMGFRPGKLVYK